MINEKIKLNEDQLTMLVADIAKEIWNVNISIPINVSKKMKRMFGYFMTKTNGRGQTKAVKLSFAYRLVNGDYKLLTIVDVIKHELAHYMVFTNGIGFHDGDMEFENELIRIGAHSTGTLAGAGESYFGVCSCCGKVATRGNEKKVMKQCAIDSTWVSRCCGKKIKYVGKEYREDKTVERLANDVRFRGNNLKSINKLFNNAKQNIQIPKVITSNIITKKAASNPMLDNTDITSIIVPGPKGVTRSQVHPVMVNAIDNNNEQLLILINQQYPEFFSQVLKYISKKRLSYVQSLNIL